MFIKKRECFKVSRIQVENISKKFGDFVAVNNVSFDAKEGELVALLGPSGSGKSTILRIISGLEIPDRGQIFLDGQDVTHRLSRKRNVGFVFQHYALFKHMTVEKNIAFGLEIKKRKKDVIKEKVRELINLVNLNGYEKHFPSQLSGGQRQRVALARALAPEPKIVLLDEPFGSLDARVRENLAHWIRELHYKINLTSIFVTHDQSEAIRISDKIIAINRGSVEQIGTAQEVYEHPQSKFVASFIGNTNVISGVVKDGLFFLSEHHRKISIKLNKNTENGPIVLLIRPEDINIYEKENNSINGIVNDIHYCGSFFQVDISIGDLIIKSIEEKNKFLKKNIKKGDKTGLQISHYKIFNAPEGPDTIREKLRQLGYIE